jgi:outer membrane lipoprotein-sorting protein
MDGMSIFATRPALRWLVPVAVTAVVVGGGATVRTIAASAEPSLPARSAAQLLVDLQTATLDGLSGTVRTNADLGLPALPDVATKGSTDITQLLTGSRTARVWYSGPDKVRVALLGTLGEADVVRNGKDVWQWDSKARKAVHSTLSSDDGQDLKKLPQTPQDAADLALKALDPTTTVSTGSSARVAGRDAYELILTPKDTSSLVGQVRLAIDAKEHVPLRVQVFAKGTGQPAFEVAFTQVSFDRPADSQFEFKPPPGTAVEESTGPDQAANDQAANDRGTQVIGQGWAAVVRLTLPAASSAGPADEKDGGRAQAQSILDQLPRVSGDWGSGRLISGKLFSVLLTDDNRLFAGAVSPERLYEAARAK